MMKIRKFLLVLVLTLTSTLLYAQKEIHGTVTDTNGEPIIGASVIPNSGGGAVTDIDGNFTLKVKEGDVLKISYVGFVTQSVKVGSGSNIKVVMQEDNQSLNEVVVIGYGTVKKRDLTAAVSKMDAKAIEDRPMARAEQALQGQLAGVQVRTVSGEPGADLQIRVRGAASVNASSDPLYVVDGVPMTTINSLNPADIQSIEVLKDAASAAIYGSRGSNGVVIVTTKRGKNGKPTVSFDGSFGFQQTERKLDILSATEWMEFRTKWNDANYLQRCETLGVTGASIKDDSATRLANVGVAAGSESSYLYVNDDRWFQYMSQEMRDTHTYDDSGGTLSLLDWQDKCFRTAALQNYNLSVTGGTDNVQYLISGGYMDQDGVVVGTKYQRFTARANIDAKINKYISIGANLAPTYVKIKGAGSANGKDKEVHHILAFVPVTEPEVGYHANVEPYGRYNWAGKNSAAQSSPYDILTSNINKDNNVRLLVSTRIYLRSLSCA